MDEPWSWQLVLPVFYLVVLGILLVVVFRGRGPRRFGPRVFLPRELTPDQENRITRQLYLGNRAWAETMYAEMTGADADEAAYAIAHWSER